jgi:hypothetical protein
LSNNDSVKIVFLVVAAILVFLLVVSSQVASAIGADTSPTFWAILETIFWVLIVLLIRWWLGSNIGPQGTLAAVGVIGWLIWWQVLDNIATKSSTPAWWDTNLAKWGIEGCIVGFILFIIFRD